MTGVGRSPGSPWLCSWEPAAHFWDGPEATAGTGSQQPFPKPAPQTPLWLSVPPSISKDDPSGEAGVKEVKTKVNSTLTLECECRAVPPPTISWYKDGRVSLGPRGPPASAWNLPEKAVRAPGPRAGLGPAPLYILIRNPALCREQVSSTLNSTFTCLTHPGFRLHGFRVQNWLHGFRVQN